MRQQLDVQRIVSVNPDLSNLADEEQVNVNHVACPAGVDTKKRLYVRRRGGALLMYCHHCQGRGVYRDGPQNHIRGRSKPSLPQEFALPYDMTREIEAPGRAWLSSVGISQMELQSYGIGWSPSHMRVVLPIYYGVDLVAYQLRKCMPTDKLPKYITRQLPGIRNPVFLGTQVRRSDTLLLVEDILSAIVCSRHVDAAALLGTGMSEENLMSFVSMGYERFVIALDNDNPDVREKQRKLVKMIAPFGEPKLVRANTDPKTWRPAQIIGAVK